MLSDRDALFAAICANPDEDTPRLMFADWLDEQGDEASSTRAEFIRLQCELARLADDASDSQPLYEFLCTRDYVTRPAADWTKIDDGIHRRIALTIRAEDLLKQHGEAWLPKLPKKYKLEWSGFHRGFPHRVRFGSVQRLREAAKRLYSSVPAVTLIADTFGNDLVDELASSGLLGWLSGLVVHDSGAAGLWALGHRPEAAKVRRLTVHHGPRWDTAAALAGAPYWTGLQEVDLSNIIVTAEAAERIFRSPHLRTLRRLLLRGEHWTTDTIRALTAGNFTELISLRLSHCGLDDDAAELLANCSALANLRMLDLAQNNLTGRGVTALLTSPHLANVAFLGLEGSPSTGLDAKRLTKATPGSLRMFHAHGCQFNTKDVRALSRCPRLRTLWYLDLDANNIGTPAVRELVRGFKDWCPPIVWLTHNRIDDRGAQLLADWKAASALRVLHLKYNAGMTDAGARTLLDSPNLTNLDGLGVSGASDETEALMKARFRFHDIAYY